MNEQQPNPLHSTDGLEQSMEQLSITDRIFGNTQVDHEANQPKLLEYEKTIQSQLSNHLKNVEKQDKTALKIFNIETSDDLLPISERHYLILNGFVLKDSLTTSNTDSEECRFSKLVNTVISSIISTFDKQIFDPLLTGKEKLPDGKNFLFYLIKKPENRVKLLVAISGYCQINQEEYERYNIKLNDSVNEFNKNRNIEVIFVPFSRKEERSIIKNHDSFAPIQDSFVRIEQIEHDVFTNKMSLMAKLLQGSFSFSDHAANTILKELKLCVTFIGDFNESYLISKQIKKIINDFNKKNKKNKEIAYVDSGELIESITMTLIKRIQKNSQTISKDIKYDNIQKNISFLKNQSHRIHVRKRKDVINEYINGTDDSVISKYEKSLKNLWEHVDDIDIFNMIQYQSRCSEDNLIDYLSYHSDTLKEEGIHYIFSIKKADGISKNSKFKIPIRPPCSYCILHFPLELSIIASSKAGLPIFTFKNRLEIPKSVEDLSIKEKLLYLSRNAEEHILKNVFNKFPFPQDEFYQSYLKNAVKRNMKDVLKMLNFKSYDDGSSKALYDAALVGSTKVIDYLINNQDLCIDYKIVHENNDTALHAAVNNNHLETVQMLLKLDKTSKMMYQKNKDNLSPLDIASYYKREDIFEKLVNNIADEKEKLAAANFKIISSDGNRNSMIGFDPLSQAIKSSNIKTIKYIWDLQKKLEHENKFNRQIQLQIAAKRGDYEIIDFLVNEAFLIKTNDHNDSFNLVTATNIALSKGHKEIASFLLEKMNVDDMEKFIKGGVGKRTEIHYLSIYGFHHIIEYLLKSITTDEMRYFFCTKLDEHGNKPLYYSIMLGYKDVSDILFNNGAEVNDNKKQDNSTPLHLAVLSCRKDIVDDLLERGAKINAQMVDGATPLHLAAQNDRRHIVEALLNKGADVNIKRKNGDTPLHLAAQWDFPEIVETLLKYHATINMIDNNGDTPLHLAVIKGNRQIVVILLNHGGVVDGKNINDGTPLHMAAQMDHPEILETLLNNFLSKKLHSNEFKKFVNAITDQGNTPLHLAAEEGNLKVAETLLISGALVDSQNKNGSTSLHKAAGKGYQEVVKTLLKYKATVDAKNNDGYTPLHLAVENDRLEVAKDLLAQGADVFARNSHDTVLHKAVISRNPDLIGSILDAIRNKSNDKDKVFKALNAQDGDGDTPLNYAIELCNSAALQLLIDAEADLSITNNDKMTPLKFAAQREHWAISVTLIKFGADIKDLDDKQYDFLKQHVKQSNYQNKVELLQIIEKRF